VIETYPSVIEVYHQHGRKFGSSLDEIEVKRRFKAARRTLFAVDTSANDQIEGALISSDGIERDLWRSFIEFVFDDVAKTTELFITLWDFFADPINWRVYPDVAECFFQLKQRGHYVEQWSYRQRLGTAFRNVSGKVLAAGQWRVKPAAIALPLAVVLWP